MRDKGSPRMVLEMHDSRMPAAQRACGYCGAMFAAKRAWQRFCKPSCRARFHRPPGLKARMDKLEERVAALEALAGADRQPGAA